MENQKMKRMCVQCRYYKPTAPNIGECWVEPPRGHGGGRDGSSVDRYPSTTNAADPACHFLSED